MLSRRGLILSSLAVSRALSTQCTAITGLSSIVDRYDAFLLDQFGVMHDGKNALPGAVECFHELAKRNKKLIVLSNTSRRRDHAVSKLPKIGFDSEALLGFVCSGELAWQHMAEHCRGQRCLWISWSEDFMAWQADYLDGTGVGLAPAGDADFVLVHGSHQLRDGIGAQGGVAAAASTGLAPGEDGAFSAALEESLAMCLARGLPMLCANPDLYVTFPDGSRGNMPGLIAERYEELGGRVIYFGKPHRPAFDAALAMLAAEAQIDPARVLHIGDSLAHDVCGASAAGVDSLFVAGGIHAEELGIDEVGGGGEVERTAGTQLVQQPSNEALQRLFKAYDASPTYSTSTFAW